MNRAERRKAEKNQRRFFKTPIGKKIVHKLSCPGCEKCSSGDENLQDLKARLDR